MLTVRVEEIPLHASYDDDNKYLFFVLFLPNIEGIQNRIRINLRFEFII